MVIIERNPYKSIIIQNEEGENITLSEGDQIQFCLDSGLVKKGKITKLQGKDDKLKIQMIPDDGECEQIWPVVVISEGSLKLKEDEEEEEE